MKLPTISYLILTLFFVLVFVLNPSSSNAQWNQLGSDIDGEAAGDRSGWSIDMPDARTIAIGAQDNDAAGSGAGHVRIFTWDGSTWSQKGIDIDGDSTGDSFGFALAMPDTNTIAIGARRSDRAGSNAGLVRVYQWNGNSWIPKGNDLFGENAGDEFGFSVAMSDSNNLVVGARRNDGNGSNSGHIRAFSWNGNAWIQKGIDLDGENSGDELGISVSMPSSNVIAAGAYRNDGNGSNSGHARVYEWTGTAWTQKGLDINGDTAGDQSGFTIHMPDVNHIAIGSVSGSKNGFSSGHTNIFEWDGSSWAQIGSSIVGDSINDNSSTDLEMLDSNTIIIGAPNHNGNGSLSGHARVLRWDGVNWVQIGSDINGESADDRSGYSVAITNDSTIAIGATQNSGFAQFAGHVRIFRFGNITHVRKNSISNNLFSIFPNPTSGELSVVIDEDSTLTLQILDLRGKLIREFQLNGRITNLDLTDLTQGIYFLRYGEVTKKLVIAR